MSIVKKWRRGWLLLPLLLAAIVIVDLLVFPTLAEEKKPSITEGVPDSVWTSEGDVQVYYGQNRMVSHDNSVGKGNPIAWRVMESDKGKNEITLLSDKLLGRRIYDTNGHQLWSGSDISQYLNGDKESDYKEMKIPKVIQFENMTLPKRL